MQADARNSSEAPWDGTWRGSLQTEPPDLNSPSLANDIDALKLRKALEELGCVEVRAFGAGIYPPRPSRTWLRLTKRFDSTAFGDLLEWYFMLSARCDGA